MTETMCKDLPDRGWVGYDLVDERLVRQMAALKGLQKKVVRLRGQAKQDYWSGIDAPRGQCNCHATGETEDRSRCVSLV